MTNLEAIETLKIKKECYDYEGLSCDMSFSECESGCSLCAEAIDMAIEALEKQMPKKPVNYDSVPHSRCPVCNNAVKVFEDAHEYHYCLYCGQCLDWSDE